MSEHDRTVSPEAEALVSALVDGACEWQHLRERGERPSATIINGPRDALLAYISGLEAARAR